jgi:AcrR family transcriptional regulator
MSTRERLTNLYEQYLKKRPRQSRSRTIVDSILRGALDRLASGGGDTAGLKIEDVAARAGVAIGSVYDYFPNREGLLASAVAKVTEENLEKFEAVLVRVRPLPLREAITEVVDFAFATYLDNHQLTRSFVRLADTNELFPVLVRSQDAVAQKLAADLARRDEVKVDDHDVAAWLLVNTLMGAIQVIVWDNDDEPRLARERIKLAWIDMALAYLTSPRLGHA